MRKGYKAEYEVKKVLFKKYSPERIFKIAIGGKSDFCVIGKNGKILKFIEVKKTKKKKWYPTEQELKQYQKLKSLNKKYKIKIEYWIKINGRWKIFDLKSSKIFSNYEKLY